MKAKRLRRHLSGRRGIEHLEKWMDVYAVYSADVPGVDFADRYCREDLRRPFADAAFFRPQPHLLGELRARSRIARCDHWIVSG